MSGGSEMAFVLRSLGEVIVIFREGIL